MNELKPCPFCGGEPTIIVRKGKDGWRDRYCVLCDYESGGCGAESGWYHYEVEAIEAWNRRAEQGQSAKATETEALLNRYANAARTIALYLDEFCDTKKPYDEMIACAARSAAEELERVKQERDAAVKDMQEIMALTSEMRVCTKYCVNGHCYNRGGNMPCSPRWDASWSGHKMED